LTAKQKKALLLHLPYGLFFLLGTKLGQGYRFSPGADFQTKSRYLIYGLRSAFRTLMPGLYPLDLVLGIAVAGGIYLAVYIKGKDRKKFRKDEEYGSARWGTREDIEPFIDPDPQNNVILTATESLTMNSRPKDPKTARNKNVLVIGGSGSGKTRFFLKPNLLQMHSSYVVTDPKGSLIVECGLALKQNGYCILLDHDKYSPFMSASLFRVSVLEFLLYRILSGISLGNSIFPFDLWSVKVPLLYG